MKRKKSEADLAKLIHDLGWDWKKFEDKRTCPKCMHMLYRVDNRPYDGIATIRGGSIPIEVKWAKERYAFSDLKEHQREGMADWQLKHGCMTWLFLQLGDKRVTAKNDPYRRRCWLLPLNAILDIEYTVSVYDLKSLAISKDTTNRKVVKEAKLHADSMLKNYELEWKKGGWVLPPYHLFRQMYLIAQGAEI